MTTEPQPAARVPSNPQPVKRRWGLGGVMGSRMNRKVFWMWAAGLIAVAVALSFLPSGGAGGVGAVTAYFWVILFTARLHDIGRSGWWQVALYAAQVAVIFGLVFGANWPVDSAADIGGLLQLIAVVALGVIPGQRGPNRFGPAPGEPAAETVSETFS